MEPRYFNFLARNFCVALVASLATSSHQEQELRLKAERPVWRTRGTNDIIEHSRLHIHGQLVDLEQAPQAAPTRRQGQIASNGKPPFAANNGPDSLLMKSMRRFGLVLNSNRRDALTSHFEAGPAGVFGG